MSLSQHEHMRQAQQNTDHSMPSGASYPPPMPTLPIRTSPLANNGKSRGLIVNLGKISLFSIFFSVMIVGGLTFLGGFFLGIWLAGPLTTPIGIYSEKPQNVQTSQADPSSASNAAMQAFAGQTGYAAQSIISNATVPDVPSFLAPLVTATQTAAGQQLGYKAQQEINQHLQNSAPSTPRSQQKPRQYNSPVPSTPPAYQAPQNTPVPTPLSQKGDYSIQLGVYASKENADALVNQLQELNINAQTTTGKDGEGNTIHFVHSGLYTNYNQALEAASYFADHNIPGATVTNVSQENKSVP